MKRVLITGATGFIGRQSLLPLLARGFEVHAICSKDPIENVPCVTWHKADLLEEQSTEKLCAAIRATHLLHFAWYVNPKDYKTSPENGRWVEATCALLRAFRECGGTRAVLAGTCMEYDWAVPQDMFSEDTSLVRPTTIYGIAKNETRLLCERYAKENNLSLAWGRIFFLYGPNEAHTRLVPLIINALLEGETPRITAGGLVRDYSHVCDTAGAFAALLDSDVNGVVNIASGEPVTLKNIAVSVAQIVDRPDLVQPIAEVMLENEPARIVGCITRLRNEVGWSPHYDMYTGLTETIRWWNKARKQTPSH